MDSAWREVSCDLTNAQWQVLQHLIPSRRGRGRSAVSQRREVINAILYVLGSGCHWRLLPTVFPLWKIVYWIIYHLRLHSVWARMHDTLGRHTRQEAGKQPTPTTGIIDP